MPETEKQLLQLKNLITHLINKSIIDEPADIYKQAEIDRGYFHRILKGKKMSFATKEKIEQFYGVKLSDFDQPKPNNATPVSNKEMQTYLYNEVLLLRAENAAILEQLKKIDGKLMGLTKKRK